MFLNCVIEQSIAVKNQFHYQRLKLNFNAFRSMKRSNLDELLLIRFKLAYAAPLITSNSHNKQNDVSHELRGENKSRLLHYFTCHLRPHIFPNLRFLFLQKCPRRKRQKKILRTSMIVTDLARSYNRSTITIYAILKNNNKMDALKRVKIITVQWLHILEC